MTEQRHLTVAEPPYDPDDDQASTNRDLDAERAVLGAMLLDPAARHDVAHILNGTDFSTLAHELIYDTIATLTYTGHPVDPITVADHLTADDLRRAGGRTYLHQLATSVATTANATYYADIILRHADLRRLDDGLTSALAAVRNPGDQPVADILNHAREAFDRTCLSQQAVVSTWTPLDLTQILAADTLDLGPRPTLLARRDGHLLLYPAAIHSISGEPGSGKTWVAVLAAAQELTEGHDVLYVDFEDRAETLVSRLRAIGVDDQLIGNHLRYIRPQAALDPAGRNQLDIAATGCTIAVVDGITEAMTLHGLSLMDNEDVARWLALIPHHIANHGPAVIQIDHVVKNSEQRGRYAIGGQHKLAGITGAAYKMITTKAFGRGAHGHAKLVLDKDRHGHIGPGGTTVADFHLDATDDTGLVHAWLDNPVAEHSEDGAWRPTGYMAKVSGVLQVTPGASTNVICSAVRGKRTHIIHAIQQLIAEGYVRVEEGARGAAHHHLISPFTEAPDDTD